MKMNRENESYHNMIRFYHWDAIYIMLLDMILLVIELSDVMLLDVMLLDVMLLDIMLITGS